MKFIYRHLGEI